MSKSKYAIYVKTPCSPRKYAEHLAKLIKTYAKDRDKERERHKKALHKINLKIGELETRLFKMGDDVLSDDMPESPKEQPND